MRGPARPGRIEQGRIGQVALLVERLLRHAVVITGFCCSTGRNGEGGRAMHLHCHAMTMSCGPRETNPHPFRQGAWQHQGRGRPRGVEDPIFHGSGLENGQGLCLSPHELIRTTHVPVLVTKSMPAIMALWNSDVSRLSSLESYPRRLSPELTRVAKTRPASPPLPQCHIPDETKRALRHHHDYLLLLPRTLLHLYTFLFDHGCQWEPLIPFRQSPFHTNM